jgi:chromosome partitioning protein
MKVVSIANTSGGSGKSTSAHALAVAFAEYGKKTLLIDLDSKSSLTFRLGFEGERLSAADFLSGTTLREDLVLMTQERFDFIGSDSRLINVIDLLALSRLLKNLPKNYDLVVLDHAPSFNPLLSMACEISDLFIIPVKDDLHSLRGGLQVKALLESTIQVASLHIGSPNELTPKIDALIAPLDVSIELSGSIELAAATKYSVLTHEKESAVSQSFRSAAYSILELLGMD